MLRRDFIKATGAVLAASAFAEDPLFGEASATTNRSVLPLNRKWRYHPGVVSGGEAVDFDDSQFVPVVLPHTNISLPWHSFDNKLYEFVSTYRRRFHCPAYAQGKNVFVDFEGVMTASTVWINGHLLGEYKGGFTPFSFDLTPYVHIDAENVLVVQVDSTERPDIPPFGYQVDYMTFGGIYREVSLRIVSTSYIDNIFARPIDVMNQRPSLEVDCFLAGSSINDGAHSLQVELRSGERTIAKATRAIPKSKSEAADKETPNGAVHSSSESSQDPRRNTVSLVGLQGIELWDLDHPNLYSVHVQLLRSGRVLDEDSRRIGFRDAAFTDAGFRLNGQIIKLRGLDRHQTFPFMGQAASARVQRKDAMILKQDLHCNIVRTSHYPQSRHFLDCCDEIGLLVLEEIPGWQHIGDEPWKLIAIDNVGRMIRRDWNRPSIILWGVRINESLDDHSFYIRTNSLAHDLDATRQTGGIRYFQESEFLEDVFTMNDFGFPLKPPNHPRYLNTEFVGHTYPTKTTDDDERQREHTLRHARIHNQLASNPQYAGGIGWCAFDYNTHANFGAGDRICYHGVLDIFREPKPAAGFYKSQCDPKTEVVVEPAFHWANSDESDGFTKAVVCSNCDHLKFYLRERSLESKPWVFIAELDPDRAEFSHLTYPPFILDWKHLDLAKFAFPWGDLRIDGFIQGAQVASRSFSGSGVDNRFTIRPDDLNLVADGSDMTRVVFRVTDEFDNVRTYANDPILLTLEGPGELIGNNPFALVGGIAAVWVRASEQVGTIRLTATHPTLGSKTIGINLTAASMDTMPI